MLRRINYTGRKRIPRSCISISLIEEAGKIKSFHATINLNELDFPGRAKVFFEAYFRMKESQRYDFGSIDNLIHPGDSSLGLLGMTENLKFRIMITDSKGKILGLAENLGFIIEPEKEALLPVDVVDLDDLLWNVNMIEHQGAPVLELNKKISGIKEVAAYDPRFIHSVYPAVVREILMHIAFINKVDLSSPVFDWESKWILFSKKISSLAPPKGTIDDAEEEILLWIDNVVKSFSTYRKTDWYSQLLKEWM